MEQRIQRTFRHDSKDKKCGFTLLSLKRNVPSWIRVISCSWTTDRWVEENRISLQYRLLCFCVFVLEQPLYLRGSRKDLKGVIYYLKITSLKVMSPSVCEWTISERLSLVHCASFEWLGLSYRGSDQVEPAGHPDTLIILNPSHNSISPFIPCKF